jgi:hypothetical protein
MISSDSTSMALRADAVAEVAEDDAAERPRGEADPVGGQREQRPRGRLGIGEEELVEDERGGRAVEEEVVPLDGGADEAGRHDLPNRPLAFRLLGRCHCLPTLLLVRRQEVNVRSRSHVQREIPLNA